MPEALASWEWHVVVEQPVEEDPGGSRQRRVEDHRAESRDDADGGSEEYPFAEVAGGGDRVPRPCGDFAESNAEGATQRSERCPGFHSGQISHIRGH